MVPCGASLCVAVLYLRDKYNGDMEGKKQNVMCLVTVIVCVNV